MRARWLATALACSAACGSPEAPRGGAGGAATQVAPLSAGTSVNHRSTSTFAAASATGQNARHKLHVVAGAEVPIALGANATHRISLGPVTPPAAPVVASVIPRVEPERADFTFSRPGAARWVVELRRRDAGVCGPSIHRTTASSLAGVSGTWLGLSPGATYCFSAAATDFRGTRTTTGTLSLVPLPTFTSGPTAGPAPAPNSFDVDVAATVSATVAGTLRYASGTCAGRQSALAFDGGDRITIPGDVLPASGFTLELWLRVDAADQTRTVASYAGGAVVLALASGRLRLDVRTLPPATGGLPVGSGTITMTDPLPTGAWVHVAASYGEERLRIATGGVTRASLGWSGAVDVPEPGLVIGGASGTGFIGQLASAAVYGRVLTTAELGAHDAAGADVELPAETARRALWTFGEAVDVQSIYDASGNHWAGVLGATQRAESDDPARAPLFPSAASLGAATAQLRARLTGLSGGPTYCYRVEARSALGTIASALGQFTRTVDTQPPRVTIDQPTVIAECAGSSAATLTVDLPTVTDDFDPSPVVTARRGAANGPLVSFPASFPLGSTLLFWSAIDASGNTGSAASPQTIRVRDTAAPVVTGGGVLTVEAVSPDGTFVSAAPASASDTCDPALSVAFTPTTALPLGDTTVRFEVSDDSGNTTPATRVVRVRDTTAPRFEPPLADVTVGHPGSGCFAFTPPVPAVADNGYPAAQLTVTGGRTSGPGMPSCWDIGTHTVEWRATDPAGNERTGVQTFIVRTSNLAVIPRGLEVAGVASPTARRWYDRSVTLVFEIGGATGPLTVSVTPQPASLTNTGAVYRARYDAAGAYPTIFVSARDAGTGVGTAALDGFGVDLTPPVIEAAFDRWLFAGETARLDEIRARDGAAELTGIGRALRFGGDDRATVPHSAAITPTVALSLETWVRVERAGDFTLLDKPSYALSVTSSGRARAQVRVGTTPVVVTGGTIRPRVWHHLAVAYDGRAVRLWVDGAPAAYRLASGAISAEPGPLVLGAALAGDLADTAVWRAAIAPERISSHWRGGLGAPIDPSAPGLAALFRYDGAGQQLGEASGRSLAGVLGADAAAGVDDPVRVELRHPAESSASGLVGLSAVLIDPATNRRSPLVATSSATSGSAILTGARLLGGLSCSAPVGSVCAAGEAVLRGEALATWNLGTSQIEVTATDAAGNVTTSRLPVRAADWVGALREAIAGVDRIAAGPPNGAANELEDARLGFSVALAYATLPRRYDDGSYLRADQGVEALLDAANLAVDVTPIPEIVARAMAASVNAYAASLRSGLAREDELFVSDASRLLFDASFERAQSRWDQQIALSRDAMDALAPIYPPYQPMRAALRRVRARWQEQLVSLAAGRTTLEQMRLDSMRIIGVQVLIQASRDMLRAVIYDEVTDILANPFTTERRALAEIRDVLDKTSSTQADELGDLIAITSPAVRDACLDKLAALDLDDQLFTRCYLRINDLARFLDGVSEPLVHTYRFRAGVAQVLFDMLELSLVVAPEGLPWVTSNVPSTIGLELVLPDAELVRGAIPVSSVDLPDMLLTRAYARHREARARLETGDIDAAWSIFLAERCLILSTFNRYYSTNRALPNVADPKESPLDPAMFGCTPG